MRKAIEDLRALLLGVAVDTNVHLDALLVVVLHDGKEDDAHATFILFVERTDLVKQLLLASIVEDLAAASKETILKAILLLEKGRNHERRARAGDTRIDIDKVAFAAGVKEDVDTAKAPKAKRLAIFDHIHYKWHLDLLQVRLVGLDQVRIEGEAPVRFATIFIGSKESDFAVRVHKEVTGNVSGNVNKLGHDKSRVARLCQECIELGLILVVSDDKDALEE